MCFPIRVIIENGAEMDIKEIFGDHGIEFADTPYGNHVSLRELDPDGDAIEVVIRSINGHCLCNLEDKEKLILYNLIDRLSACNM